MLRTALIVVVMTKSMFAGGADRTVIGEAGATTADWPTSAATPERNGQSATVGPVAPDLLWSGGRPSIIAWQPVIEGDRVFAVRQTAFPPGGEPNGSPVVAMDLHTGAELWFRHVPFNTGEWTTWIAGARDGQVYASHSGNGASISATLYALDAATGDTVWMSDDDIDAGFYDGVVFAPDGDLIIGSFRDIWRIDKDTGATVWNAARLASVSGTCGAARHGDAVYVVDSAPGGHIVRRFDLATGAAMYDGPVMTGFTLQNTPFVGADGTIYVSRTQNNVATDFFYAFDDTGSAIVERWNVPAAWTTASEFAVGPDDTVYMMGPGYQLLRLDPLDGSVIDFTQGIPGFSKPRMAVDADGNVFISNGAFATGRVYAFSADLDPLWNVAVTNVNIGGPILGADGTLVVCGVGSDLRAYRVPASACDGDADGDGDTDFGDLLALLGAWGPCAGCPEDLNGSGAVTFDDLLILLGNWGCSGG